jgi:putative two-component system response regulator
MEHANARIFAVDDEPANLRLLDRILSGHGYQNMVLIQDSREVLTRYAEGRPDLILLDLAMPHFNGFEIIQQLHDIGDPLLPPIVVLTAQHGRETMLKALDAGARDFIGKPFDRLELLARVRNLLDVQTAHRLLADQKNLLEEMVAARTQELRGSRLQIVQKLGRAAEYRDNETGAHILRMSHIAELLAQRSGLSAAETELILNASPMHDIGKIGIRDSILLKPGRLDADERKIMESHAMIGADILSSGKGDLIEMAHVIALTHHEKWDGSGYPHGRVGANTPLPGRIAAIADVFDALCSARPYKKAWSYDDAVAYMREQSGLHFDPELIRIFNANLEEIIALRARYRDDEGEEH